MSDNIRVETRDRITRIQLHRPDKKNAITQAMYQAMADAIRDAEADSETRVMLIHGTDDCFSSGNDMMDFLNNPPADESSSVVHFLRGISQAQKPVVAAVNGVAIGIGTTLLLHCDLVYAGKSARLQLPFVNIGISPEAGSSLILPAMMGHQRAAELLLLGEMIEAAHARELGLVNAVVDDAAVMDKALEKAQRLAAQPPQSLRITKSLMKRANQEQVQSVMDSEAEQFMALLQGDEAREAMTAFMEKRKPDFSRFE